MAKKNHVRIYCSQCKKRTAHEVRNTDGQESCVCLACQGTAREQQNAKVAYLNQLEAQKREVDRIIDEERVRNNTTFLIG
jgi:hypothetical protein